MNTQTTAMRDLIKQLVSEKDENQTKNNPYAIGRRDCIESILKKATLLLEKEKQQIEDAVVYGCGDFRTHPNGNYSSEDYYKETYIH